MLCLGSAAQAQIYQEDELSQTRDRISEGLRLTLGDMLAVLTPAERAQIGPVTLDLPLRSPVFSGQNTMLGFFTDVNAGRIIVPIENWSFLSDFLVLQAWFESNGCQPDHPFSYYLHIRDARLAVPPFDAFALSKSAVLRDRFTNNTSLHTLASAGEFILAHELGHLFHNHRALGAGEASVMQEQNADAFAMDVLARKGRTTAGIAFYFTMASLADRTGAGIVTTHPVSSARLDAVAERIRADPASFLADQADPVVEVPLQLSIADSITAVADLLRDEQFRQFFIKGVPEMFPATGFSTACQSE